MQSPVIDVSPVMDNARWQALLTDIQRGVPGSEDLLADVFCAHCLRGADFGDRDDAEQTAFVNILQLAREGRLPCPTLDDFFGYCLACIGNALRSQWRADKSRKKRESSNGNDYAQRPWRTVTREVRAGETRRLLQQLVDALPDASLREAMRCMYLEHGPGCTWDDLAQRLGVHEGTLRKRRDAVLREFAVRVPALVHLSR